MCLFFETIKVSNGEICNLSFHQKRVAEHAEVELLSYIKSHVVIPALGVHKLRITYSTKSIESHSIDLYLSKKVESLKIVVDNRIDYHKKYTDRTCFTDLMRGSEGCDDILIIKGGSVTDISFANIIFFDGRRWITSNSPLLEGTCRARLIEQNIITAQQIVVEDLKVFSKFMIINAMLDFDDRRAVEYCIDGTNTENRSIRVKL